jgi:hypothetical protein
VPAVKPTEGASGEGWHATPVAIAGCEWQTPAFHGALIYQLLQKQMERDCADSVRIKATKRHRDEIE